MAPELLQTFVQISDLHFGDLTALGQLKHPLGMKTLWSLFSFFTGLAGHEEQSLIDLTGFLDQMRRQEPNVSLLVTGDLTSLGKNAQFNTAKHFIGAELPRAPLAGLHTGSWLDKAMHGGATGPHLAIPGNHDHWPGRFPWLLGRPSSCMHRWAKQFPFIQQATVALKGGVRLRFLSLNTDANVWAWGPERVLARGSFQAQLRRLEEALGPADSSEVRVLLLHHSLAYRHADDPRSQPCTWLARLGHRFLARFGGILEINEASRRRLRLLLGRFDIPVILTGHTHKVDVRRHWSFSPQRKRPIPFLEACCGTTTQLNDAPSKWRSCFPDRKLDPNFLLVHRLFAEAGDRIIWRTQTYRRGRQGGFTPETGNAAGEPWSSELLVWPRP